MLTVKQIVATLKHPSNRTLRETESLSTKEQQVLDMVKTAVNYNPVQAWQYTQESESGTNERDLRTFTYLTEQKDVITIGFSRYKLTEEDCEVCEGTSLFLHVIDSSRKTILSMNDSAVAERMFSDLNARRNATQSVDNL